MKFFIFGCFFISSFFINNLIAAEYVDGRLAEEVTLAAADLDHRRLSEDNEIASTMCRMIAIFIGPIGKAIYAFILLMMGIGGYTGKLQPGALFTYVFGGIVIFAGLNILDLIVPGYGIKDGCNCKEKVIVGKKKTTPGSESVYEFSRLHLKKNCKSY